MRKGKEPNKALEAVGWETGDAADFLGMSDEERQILDMRMEIVLAVRRMRREQGLTQSWLAKKLKTTQPRVARIEAGSADVTFDQLLRAFVALGGRLTSEPRAENAKKASASKPGKPNTPKASSRPSSRQDRAARTGDQLSLVLR